MTVCPEVPSLVVLQGRGLANAHAWTCPVCCQDMPSPSLLHVGWLACACNEGTELPKDTRTTTRMQAGQLVVSTVSQHHRSMSHRLAGATGQGHRHTRKSLLAQAILKTIIRASRRTYPANIAECRGSWPVSVVRGAAMQTCMLAGARLSPSPRRVAVAGTHWQLDGAADGVVGPWSTCPRRSAWVRDIPPLYTPEGLKAHSATKRIIGAWGARPTSISGSPFMMGGQHTRSRANCWGNSDGMVSMAWQMCTRPCFELACIT